MQRGWSRKKATLMRMFPAPLDDSLERRRCVETEVSLVACL
jgi:hypothetical protein